MGLCGDMPKELSTNFLTMSDQFLNANVTYKGLEDKGLTVYLLDENKKKWVIWKAKQNGDESEAWASFQNHKIGETFGVSYKEKEKTFTGKDGKNVTYTEKTIYSIMPPIDPSAITKPQPKPVPQAKSSTERNFDEENVGKCQSLFLAAYIQSGKSIADAKTMTVEARRLAELVVYRTQKTEPAYNFEDNLPDPQYDRGIDGIPF